MSLNSDFNNNPIHFIGNMVILVPGGVTAGAGNFDLVNNTPHSCLLHSDAGGSLNGFYVWPQANNNNQYTLVNTVDYMFTDCLNGCQFLAYGPDRHNVTVEHNNFIANPAQYELRAELIAGQGHAYTFMFRPGIDYNILNGASIIGAYDINNGWRFWVRMMVVNNNGTVIGPC